jgi:UDP-perosamine 4-acetyltransferase
MNSATDTRPVLIIGGGGHAKVVVSVLRVMGVRMLGAVDSDPGKHGGALLGVGILGDDEAVAGYAPAEVRLANGIGSVRLTGRRTDVFDRFAGRGYRFVTLAHPSAVIAEGVTLGEGCQIMAGAVLQPEVSIGRNVIVNTGATVDHDCAIGDHVHIAPGATLSGGIVIGDGTHIGAGATIVQGIAIGRRCLVRAGAVVIDDVPDGAMVAGIPARAA